MKRNILTFALVLLMSLSLFPGDLSVNFNINYNFGTADFFNLKETTVTVDDKNFLDTRDNRMGFGFNLTVNIPVMERLYVVPGIGVVFGRQNYEYIEVDDQGDPVVSDANEAHEYYFYIYSGELGMMYDLLKFKSGWDISVLGGLTYNLFRPNEKMNLEEENYFGAQFGLGARFFELKHLGVQLFGYYRFPFSADLMAHLGAQFGISYRF